MNTQETASISVTTMTNNNKCSDIIIDIEPEFGTKNEVKAKKSQSMVYKVIKAFGIMAVGMMAVFGMCTAFCGAMIYGAGHGATNGVMSDNQLSSATTRSLLDEQGKLQTEVGGKWIDVDCKPKSEEKYECRSDPDALYLTTWSCANREFKVFERNEYSGCAVKPARVKFPVAAS